MKVKISNLSLGEHIFDFEEKVEDLELGEPYFGKIKTNIRLNKLQDQIITYVSSEIYASFECDRCTAKFERLIQSNYEMIYLMNEKPEDTDDIHITYISRDTDKLDFDNDVREFAILAIPMKKLCKEDCKGLCPRCGADLNYEQCSCPKEEIDPRWEKLFTKKF